MLFSKQLHSIVLLTLSMMFTTQIFAGNSSSHETKSPNRDNEEKIIKPQAITCESYFEQCLQKTHHRTLSSQELINVLHHVETSIFPSITACLTLAHILLQYSKASSFSIATYEAINRICEALVLSKIEHDTITKALDAHPHARIKTFDIVS
jgi:hypothetical protein